MPPGAAPAASVCFAQHSAPSTSLVTPHFDTGRPATSCRPVCGPCRLAVGPAHARPDKGAAVFWRLTHSVRPPTWAPQCNTDELSHTKLPGHPTSATPTPGVSPSWSSRPRVNRKREHERETSSTRSRRVTRERHSASPCSCPVPQCLRPAQRRATRPPQTGQVRQDDTVRRR